MFRQHPIPFDTGEEERLLGPLSVSATIWLCGGFFLSYRLAKAFPPLPLPHIFRYVHYFIPVFISAVCAFVRYKDMTILQYIQVWHNYRKSKKRLMFELQDFMPMKTKKDEKSHD